MRFRGPGRCNGGGRAAADLVGQEDHGAPKESNDNLRIGRDIELVVCVPKELFYPRQRPVSTNHDPPAAAGNRAEWEMRGTVEISGRRPEGFGPSNPWIWTGRHGQAGKRTKPSGIKILACTTRG